MGGCQALAIHLIRQNHVATQSFPNRQTARVIDFPRRNRFLLNLAAVNSFENNFNSVRFETRLLEDVGQGNTRPLGVAHSAQFPLQPADFWGQKNATVAGAFHHHGYRPRGQRAQLVEAQVQSMFD